MEHRHTVIMAIYLHFSTLSEATTLLCSSAQVHVTMTITFMESDINNIYCKLMIKFEGRMTAMQHHKTQVHKI
jgi:hypothetical protein